MGCLPVYPITDLGQCWITFREAQSQQAKPGLPWKKPRDGKIASHPGHSIHSSTTFIDYKLLTAGIELLLRLRKRKYGYDFR